MPVLAAVLLSCLSLSAAETLRLRFVAARTELPSCSGLIRIEPGREPVPFTAATPVAIERASPDALRLRVEARGCWAAPLEVAADATSIDVPLWPAARIHAAFAVPRGETAPSAVSLKLRTDDRDLAEVPCAHELEERWTCIVPATKLDVRIDPKGFVPHYLWSVPLAPSSTHDAGRLALRRGPSISGRVVAHDGKLGGVTVFLVPSGRGEGTALARMQAKPDARGFFQFDGFELGRYDVSAEREGASSAHLTGIAVGETREVVLEKPLSLEPLASLEVMVTPPVTPSGKPWRVRLERVKPGTSMLTAVHDAVVDAAGGWSADELTHGEHVLSVIDGTGSVVQRERVMVDNDMPLLPIAVDSIAIRGRVTAGGDPIAAKITLAWRDGSQVKFESGDDGTFSGTVPHEGEWKRVEVTPSVSGSPVSLPPVLIERRPGADAAEVELALPGGHLSGKVVDEQGAPLYASVRIADADHSIVASLLTSRGGEFEILGLAAGGVTVQAETEDGASEYVPLTIGEDEAAKVRLVVRRQLRVKGIVVNASGHPVAGAAVRAIVHPADAIREAFTGPSGQFDFLVPPGVPVVDLIAYADGFPLCLMTVRTSNDLAEVVLGNASATLAVRLDVAPPWPFIRRNDGRFVSMALLAFPRIPTRRAGGIGFVIEPGMYTICPAPARTERCIERTIGAGQREVVDVTTWNRP